MTTHHRPITRDEESMTPRAILAEAVGFCGPLTIEQVGLVCDAGLAVGEEFEPIVDSDLGLLMLTGYRYVGDAWEVEFRHGRPILVERGTAATGYVAEVERRFAWTLHLVGGPEHESRTDEDVAEIRSGPGWARSFAEAEAADRRMQDLRRRGGPELELAAERLARARAVVARLGVELTGMWSDPLRIGDESVAARYALVTGTSDATGERLHSISFHADAAAAVEGVLCLIVLQAWLLGAYDLDRADHVEPLMLQALVGIEGDPQVAVRRMLPFTASEEEAE